MPRDAAIELRFDRFLDPATASRQSLRVYIRYPDLGVFLETRYDPVERVVSYRPFGGGPWAEDTLYSVEIVLPSDESPDGFRAFDGATLDIDEGDARFAFRTARAMPEGADAPPVVTCREVLTLFDERGCAAASCHGGPSAAAGLRLDSGAALEQTAIRRVARETDIGAEVGQPLVDPARFGVQMPLIAPESPSNSYLLYKLLVNQDNLAFDAGVCSSAYRAPVEPAWCVAPSPAEIDRLRRWFVRLDPMPPGGARVSPRDLRQIERFIEAGASVADCL